MKKITLAFVGLGLHILALGIIVYAFLPMAKWYLDNPTLPATNLNIESKPLWGVDFFYTVTLTNFLKNNFSIPPGVWNYIWFSGWPYLSSFPILHFYLIIPLLSYFNIISAVKIYMLVSLGFFFAGLYACFWRLSRNFVLSVALAIAAIYSVGVYGTLMWGGSLPNHATQTFFPWVIFFVIAFLQTSNLKYLLSSSLLAGLAIWGHPQIVISYVYPAAVIIFTLAWWGIKFIKRIKYLLFFLATSILIGLPLLYSSFAAASKTLIVTDTFKVASSTARVDSQLEKDIKAFHRKQPERVYVDTNTMTFVLLGISAIFYLTTLAIRRKLRDILLVLPFIALSVFFVVYIYLFSFGISIYHGGWYRLFWATPFWLGLLAASFWGSFQEDVEQLLHKYNLIVISFLSVFIFLISISLLPEFSKNVKERIIPRSNPSSSFPDILNLREGKGFEELKSEMTPKWMNPNDTNYRFYSADQTVNIWWNSLFKMPLGRGYLDPPDARTKGYTFWLDAAMSEDVKGGQQLVTAFNYPEDIAFNNTLYLLNWYSIKYIDSGHAGPTSLAQVPPRLLTEDYIKNKEILDFNKEKFSTGNKTLNFYEVKDEFVSPILSPTNAATLGIIASDEGYETVVRGISDSNIGVSKLIPIRIGRNLDSLSLNDLLTFDALLLYDYKYKNKDVAFSRVTNFVKKGGNVFIDTGVETPDSESKELPEIFPITQSVRKPMGSSWVLESGKSEIASGIDFSSFSPPMFDQYEWKLSYPESSSLVRKKATDIIKNKGTTVMAEQKIGEGSVIWSGMNLPYHVSRYHNPEEIKFYSKIITRLTGDSISGATPQYSTKFINAQKRIIETSGGKGILFKEQNYPGWSVKLKSEGKSRMAKIWSAGPAYPGFMYVRIPEEFKSKEISTTFTYRGSLASWLLFLISVVLSIFILENILIGGKILGRSTRFIISLGKRYLTSWWAKEEE